MAGLQMLPAAKRGYPKQAKKELFPGKNAVKRRF